MADTQPARSERSLSVIVKPLLLGIIVMLAVFANPADSRAGETYNWTGNLDSFFFDTGKLDAHGTAGA